MTYTEELEFTIQSTQQLLNRPQSAVGEFIAFGDGLNPAFDHDTTYLELRHGFVTVTDGAETYQDDGNGNLVNVAVPIVAELFAVGRSPGDPLINSPTFTNTIINPGIQPGSIMITDGVETFFDTGIGPLEGALGGFGFADYASGTITITFTYIPPPGTQILINYTSIASGLHGTVNYVSGHIHVVFTNPPLLGAIITTSYQWQQYYPTAIYVFNLGILMTSITDVDVVASKYVDLIQLVPEKFRGAEILQEYLRAVGLYTGIWLTKIDNMLKLLDIYSVSDQFKETIPAHNLVFDEEYMSRLGALIGLTITKGRNPGETEEQYRDRLRRQLINAIDWYKIKGTYQALQDAIYITNQAIAVKDLYTNDYINFIQEDWFIASYPGENPPGLDATYYKSPHFGLQIVLNQVFMQPPANPYLWKGDDKFANVRALVEEIRPVNTVPTFIIEMDAQCNEDGTLYTVSATQVKSIRLYEPWVFTRQYFDQDHLGPGQTFHFDNDMIIPITAETYGTGDGGTVTFIHTMDNVGFKIREGFVTVTDGVEIFIDNGDGTLTGNLGGAGTINYTNGICNVTFQGAPAKGVGITTDYQYFFGSGRFFDFSQLAFLESVTVWKLGTGNKGVSPDTPGWNLVTITHTGTMAFPQTIRILPDRTEYEVVVNQSIVEAGGFSELGLYLSDGTTLVIGCTLPDIFKIAGVELRIILRLLK